MSDEEPVIKVSYLFEKPVLNRLLGTYVNSRPVTSRRAAANVYEMDESRYTVEQITEFLQEYGLVRQAGRRSRRDEEIPLYSATAKGEIVYKMVVNLEQVQKKLKDQIRETVTTEIGAEEEWEADQK